MKKAYAYHKPSAVGIEKIRKIRESYSALHDLIEEIAPHSRERSVALTELETSAMWATGAATPCGSKLSETKASPYAKAKLSSAVVCNDPESEVAP